MTINTNINLYNALTSALDYLEINAEDTLLIDYRPDKDSYELLLCTDWLFYTCYVDRLGGEVIGCDCEPTVDGDNFNGLSCAALLDEMSALSA